MPSTAATQTRSTRWSLEVVRRRDVGMVFELPGGEVILGSGLDGSRGLDLRDQEAGSPRRMAARQATVETQGADIVIRDLDSPGGTFVNRQRLLAGQTRRLQTGDEIQVGAVLLRVVAGSGGQPSPVEQPPAAAAPPSAPPGRLAVPYSIGGNVACRSWDDFLVVAAQRWNDLRDELESGRLADYLRRIGRLDLLPRVEAGASADDRLDQWLGRLPVSQTSVPELEVHPNSLEVRATGGTTRHVLKIANVGFRLLRSTAHVEPLGTGWVRLLPPFDGRRFDTVEQTELPVEVTPPEGQSGALTAEIVIESNGGTRRVPVRLRRPERAPALPDAVRVAPGATMSDLFRPVAENVSHLEAPVRIVGAIATVLVFRALVLVSGLIPLGAHGASMTEPRLPALASLCAALGAILGMLKGRPTGERGLIDTAATGVSSGLLGILVASFSYAVVNTVERPLGAWSSSLWALALVWAILGAAIAGLSWLFVPYRGPSGRTSP